MNGPTPPSSSSPMILAPSTASEGKPRVRRQRSLEEKTAHLALFAESGLTQVEYCEEMGLSPATFSLWCRQSRVAGVAPTEGPAEPTFAEVLVTAPTAGGSPPIVIHLGAGTRIEVAVGTDPSWLASLLKTLGGA